MYIGLVMIANFLYQYYILRLMISCITLIVIIIALTIIIANVKTWGNLGELLIWYPARLHCDTQPAVSPITSLGPGLYTPVDIPS